MKKISNLKGAALMIASVMLLAVVVGFVSNKRSSGTEFVFTADNSDCVKTSPRNKNLIY